MSRNVEDGAGCTRVSAKGRTTDRAEARSKTLSGHRSHGAEPLHAPFKLGLSRNEAAAYIGIGVSKFDALVADGRMPRPKRIDGRKVWIADRLREALYALPDDGEGSASDDVWSNPSV